MDWSLFAGIFPSWPLEVGPIVTFGLLMLAGLLGGELARLLRVPQLLGYIGAGIVLGTSVFDLPIAPMLGQTRLLFDLGIGLILYELGRRLDPSWFLKDKALFAAAFAEIVLAFAGMATVLVFFGFPWAEAAMAAAIGISTAPAVVWLVARELRSDGQVTERCLNLTTLNTLTAFVVATLLMPVLEHEYRPQLPLLLFGPLYLLLGSAALGTISSRLSLWLARLIGKRQEAQFVIAIAMILLTIGIAHALELSVLLAMLVFGIDVKGNDHKHALTTLEFGGLGQTVYIVMFVVAGANLDLAAVHQAWIPALAYAAARAAGKFGGVMLTAPFSAIRARQNVLLGVTLLPMSGVAMALVHDIAGLHPELGARLANVIIAAVVGLELLGPLATYWALRWAGEAAPAENGRKHA